MNRRFIVFVSGATLLIEAALLMLPLFVSLIYGESAGWYFLYVILGCVAVGYPVFKYAKPDMTGVFARDGLAVAAVAWLLMSLVGALPFWFSGEIPSYVDAFFETVSGFTTTGSSILTDIESLSRCMLFWRSFTHWIGGMGVLVFMLAILRMEGGQSIHILRAESPGPSVSKLKPKMFDSAKILYSLYIALTLLEVFFYVIGGVPVFDAFCNAFATAGTGGFAIKGASLAAYSTYAQTVSTVFMILFGVNFSIYYFLIKRKFKYIKDNTEIRWYLGIIVIAIALITVNTLSQYDRFYDAFHHASFTVASIITTTGFATVDFNLWPQFSKTILILLMMIGACAGSTGGGMKVSRFVVLAKCSDAEIRKLAAPHTVKTTQMDGKPMSKDSVGAILKYFAIYIIIVVVSVLLISIENVDGTTTLTAVMATFNNIGPGLNLVGPTANYAFFSDFSKIVLSMDMLFGRLELYPMLVLFLPHTWARKWN